MRDAQSIIKRPLLTEKSSRLRETGGAAERHAEGDIYAQQVAFEVARDANKIEIRGAVQALFSLLKEAASPVAIVGGADWSPRASHHFANFAFRYGIPVAAAFRRHSILLSVYSVQAASIRAR